MAPRVDCGRSRSKEPANAPAEDLQREYCDQRDGGNQDAVLKRRRAALVRNHRPQRRKHSSLLTKSASKKVRTTRNEIRTTRSDRLYAGKRRLTPGWLLYEHPHRRRRGHGDAVGNARIVKK